MGAGRSPRRPRLAFVPRGAQPRPPPGDAARGEETPFWSLFADRAAADAWLSSWRRRIARDPEGEEGRAERMDRTNPAYIPRNHLVEEALAAAGEDDLGPFNLLHEVLSDPYSDQGPDRQRYAEPHAGHSAGYKTFCGT